MMSKEQNGTNSSIFETEKAQRTAEIPYPIIVEHFNSVFFDLSSKEKILRHRQREYVRFTKDGSFLGSVKREASRLISDPPEDVSSPLYKTRVELREVNDIISELEKEDSRSAQLYLKNRIYLSICALAYHLGHDETSMDRYAMKHPLTEAQQMNHLRTISSSLDVLSFIDPDATEEMRLFAEDRGVTFADEMYLE